MSLRAEAVGVIGLAALLAGCGGSSGSPSQAERPSSPSAASPSAASPSATPGVYASTVFSPAFTVRLPPGWTVAERDAGAAQLYQQCDACEHSGEENGEITLDMGEQSRSVPAALARLRQVKNAVAGPTTRVRLGALAGWEFAATRTGKGDVLFEDSGYDTDPTGAPLEVYAVPVQGRTLVVLLDPPRPGPAVRVFRARAESILRQLRFPGS